MTQLLEEAPVARRRPEPAVPPVQLPQLELHDLRVENLSTDAGYALRPLFPRADGGTSGCAVRIIAHGGPMGEVASAIANDHNEADQALVAARDAAWDGPAVEALRDRRAALIDLRQRVLHATHAVKQAKAALATALASGDEAASDAADLAIAKAETELARLARRVEPARQAWQAAVQKARAAVVAALDDRRGELLAEALVAGDEARTAVVEALRRLLPAVMRSAALARFLRRPSDMLLANGFERDHIGDYVVLPDGLEKEPLP